MVADAEAEVDVAVVDTPGELVGVLVTVGEGVVVVLTLVVETCVDVWLLELEELELELVLVDVVLAAVVDVTKVVDNALEKLVDAVALATTDDAAPVTPEIVKRAE